MAIGALQAIQAAGRTVNKDIYLSVLTLWTLP